MSNLSNFVKAKQNIEKNRKVSDVQKVTWQQKILIWQKILFIYSIYALSNQIISQNWLLNKIMTFHYQLYWYQAIFELFVYLTVVLSCLTGVHMMTVTARVPSGQAVWEHLACPGLFLRLLSQCPNPSLNFWPDTINWNVWCPILLLLSYLQLSV